MSDKSTLKLCPICGLEEVVSVIRRKIETISRNRRIAHDTPEYTCRNCGWSELDQGETEKTPENEDKDE